VARFMTPGTTVPVDWVREWARGLDGQTVLLSNHIVVDLPTRAEAAAATSVSEQLPTGARIRFLATGVEFVGEDETNRVKARPSHGIFTTHVASDPLYTRHQSAHALS